MTRDQRAICRELLRLSVDGGFGTGYLLAPISIKLGIDVPLYDSSTESGVLWNLGPYGLGLLDVADDGRWASVNWDTHEELEVWSREPLEAINGQG